MKLIKIIILIMIMINKSQNIIIETDKGLIRGIYKENIYQFLGIPYVGKKNKIKKRKTKKI
jgi:uncharacterized membrane protein